MRIIDRYVIRIFLTVLVGAMVAIVAIFIVLNLTDNMEKFIEASAPLKAPLLYYLNFAPYIIVLTLPVGMLLASLSAIGSLVRSNELLALKASGVSSFRPIFALSFLALIIVCLSFLFSENVVPRANEAKKMIWNQYVSKQGRVSYNETINRTLDLGGGTMLFIRSFNSGTNVGEYVTLAQASGNRIRRVIQARSLSYDEAGDRWQFNQAEERIWEAGVERFLTHETLIEDLPELSPTELNPRRRDPEEMAYSDLLDYVRRGEARARNITRARIDLNMKTALPFSIFIIVLFGSSLAAVRRRAGLAVGFTASIGICFIFYFVIRAGQAFGYNGDLPPMLAAWLGNIIFGALSLFFLARARY